MVNEILTATGVEYAQGRFMRMPEGTHAVYFDDIEAAIETELDARGLSWAKQDRYWLKDPQRYQVIYEFSYTSKTK